MFQGFSTDTSVGLTLIALFFTAAALAVLCVKLYIDKLQLRDELLGRKHKAPCAPHVAQCGQERRLKLITLRSGI